VAAAALVGAKATAARIKPAPAPRALILEESIDVPLSFFHIRIHRRQNWGECRNITRHAAFIVKTVFSAVGYLRSKSPANETLKV
jgi:hypothetical protein